MDPLLLFLGALVGLLILNFVQAGGAFYAGRLRALEQFASQVGLTMVDDSRAQGRLEGLVFSVGLRHVRQQKGSWYEFKASLDLGPNCPRSLHLRNEGVLTGLQKAGRRDDLVLGDAEMDQAFWVKGESRSEVLEFFAGEGRTALLYAMPRLPGAELKDGKLTAERWFLSSAFGVKQFRAIYELFALLARGLAQPDQSLALPQGAVSPVVFKLRRFLVPSSGMLLLGLAISNTFGSGDRDFALGVALICGLGLVLSVVAGTGKDLARLLLQAYYAFLALVWLGLATAECAGVWGPRNFDDRVIVILMQLGVAVLCWGARHYLRTLGQRPEPGVAN
ncbi:MAG: hypothetical protein AB7S38_40675 [Vulcanimicrobiota bacterium]